MHKTVFGARPVIIAEIGGNHGGNVDLAVNIAESAIENGAWGVKFQLLRPEMLYRPDHPAYKIIQNECLSWDDFSFLAAFCKKKKSHFIATPFDSQGVKFLKKIDTQAVKIASCDLNNFSLLQRCCALQKPLLLSTGAATFPEIEKTISFIERHWPRPQLILLHCAVGYPVPFKDVCLKRLEALKKFGYAVGFSDHTLGINVSIAALGLGAVVIEKHFTLSRKLPYGDNAMSIEPVELKALVRAADEINKALAGPAEKLPKSQLAVRGPIRRSPAAARTLKIGVLLKEDDLLFLRPAEGLGPDRVTELLGKKVVRQIPKYAPVHPNDVR